jgi:hypothetical protein
MEGKDVQLGCLGAFLAVCLLCCESNAEWCEAEFTSMVGQQNPAKFAASSARLQ